MRQFMLKFKVSYLWTACLFIFSSIALQADYNTNTPNNRVANDSTADQSTNSQRLDQKTNQNQMLQNQRTEEVYQTPLRPQPHPVYYPTNTTIVNKQWSRETRRERQVGQITDEDEDRNDEETSDSEQDSDQDANEAEQEEN